jgi:hypothetical protein
MKKKVRLISLILWIIAGHLVLRFHRVSEIQYWLLWANMILVLIENYLIKE